MVSKLPFSTIPSKAIGKFEPFPVFIPNAKLESLRELLNACPIAEETYESTRENEELGISWKWLTDAVEQWRTSFNWRKHEAHINSFPHYQTTITDDDDQSYRVHFVGLFSQKPDAIPLLLLHGWPGSFLEFLPLLDILQNRHSPENLPYHLIVPSLPGYTFSSPPPLQRDFRVEDVARILKKLAISLGFGDGFIVQGGDVGSKVARVLAAEHKECKAIHINFCIMPEPAQVHRPISATEQTGLVRACQFHRIGSAYAIEHATKPSTIGFVLASSPIALLAWIGEKFLTWTDTDTTPPLSVILESVTLHWLTDRIATTLYPYRQLFTPGAQTLHENPRWHIPAHKPFGFSWFPKEIAPVPRAWVETTVDHLVFWREHEKGGHFAVIERTEVLLKDLEEFVRLAWKEVGTRA